MSKSCSTCRELKPYNKFHRNKSRKDGYSSQCKDCKKYTQHKWYKNNKDKIIIGRKKSVQRAKDFIQKKLLISSCVDCGEQDWVVLEFDHLHDKRKSISKMMLEGFGVATIEEEIAKCDIVCANCHRRRTYQRENSWRIQGAEAS